MNVRRIERRHPFLWACFVVMCGAGTAANGGDATRGREHLLTHAYLPADFDQEVFYELWTTWEEPLRERAARAPIAERRRMALER